MSRGPNTWARPVGAVAVALLLATACAVLVGIHGCTQRCRCPRTGWAISADWYPHPIDGQGGSW